MMTRQGLELLAAVPLVVWLLCWLHALRRLRRPVLLAYADVWRDHVGHGDEDPQMYGEPSFREPPFRVAIERRIEWFEREVRASRGAALAPEIEALRAMIVQGRRAGRISLEEADDLVDLLHARMQTAIRRRPALVKRRRDGLLLTAEASEAVLKDVFGDEPPDTGRG